MPKDPSVYYEKLSAKAAEAMGLPQGFKVFSPFPFGGMNQQSSRVATADNEFFFRENFIRIGDGNMRTLWDVGSIIYSAPSGTNIVYFYFFNIGATNYVAIFLSNGTAVQVNPKTGAQTYISRVLGTFYSGGQKPVCSQWGTRYLIIANNITPNSYWIWDGSILYAPGGLGPGVIITAGGSGYFSAPTVTAFGGSGTGITAVATISDGYVVDVVITNPGTGYFPGNIVQLAFSGGGITDSSAILSAVLSSTGVASLQIVSPGSGYTDGTYALAFTPGGGGAIGTYTVLHGVVVSLALTGGGSYTAPPAITFPSGGGAGASAFSVLSPAIVNSITVVNGGAGFTSVPTLTITGGGGTGATATATLTGGVITSVAMELYGSGYTSSPSVVVQTGINNAAAAEATIMPFGVSGSSVETFAQRVWLGFPNQTGNLENGGTILVSAPGSLTDFAPSDGGLTYTSSDSFLRYQYTNLKQSNGYLYPIGDSSVDVISNVQTSGNPVTTVFNYQNTDPQIGTSWRDTVSPFSRTILFANPFGVYGLYGGSVMKISGKMDDLFTNAVFPQDGGVTPCSAIANLFSQKIFLMLMTVTDIYTDLPRTVMLAWDEKDWFIASQSATLTFIGSQEVDSDITAWGTDGTSLFPLFSAPSSSLTKRLSTKLYGSQYGFVMKQAVSLYAQAQDLTANGAGVTFDKTTIDNEVGSFLTPNVVSFPKGEPREPVFASVYAAESGDVSGVNLGVTIETTSPDFSLFNLILGYTDLVGLFGSTNLTGYQGE